MAKKEREKKQGPEAVLTVRGDLNGALITAVFPEAKIGALRSVIRRQSEGSLQEIRCSQFGHNREQRVFPV